MVTALESKAALTLVTGAAVAKATQFFGSLSGSPEARRLALLDTVPSIIGYYADGSSALAADYYEDERERAGAPGRFTALALVPDRTVKIRRGVAWAAQPMFEGLDVTVESRLAELIQPEVSDPYRDTILHNSKTDPASVGWRRVTGACCKFCSFLGARGAVFKEDTARFASHPHCDCTAEPVFVGGDAGPVASTLQYVASRRSRTPAQRAALRDALAAF